MNITIQNIKRKQILLSLCSFAMLWGLSINLNAQVAIGLTEKPIDGALLQLKDITGVTGGAQKANKGLGMPIVELTALNTLIISGEDYNSEALKHIGLIVFNMKEDQSKNLYKAPYVWDGARWDLVYDKDCVETPRTLYFYKTAWMPKKLPVTGFVDNIDRNVNIALHADANGTVDFAGAGAILPASPQLQVDGEEEYTFQPVGNTSGDIRSTDVTFTASRSGTIGTASKTTRIVHYPYEFPVHVEPSILSATLINSGVGAVSIWSAADWKISLVQPADHDPQNMLATNLILDKEFRDETSLKLNINQNPTWNEKELKINVESVGADGKHYEDFVPQTLTVKQKANVPSIEINDPANKILDFGIQTTGSKNVIIRSNAKWTATGAGNIGDVIGSNTILGGSQHGTNSPAVPINTTIALPVSTTGTNAKAGTVYSSNITFTTAGHGTASPVSSTLAVKKTIPIRWDYPTITPASNKRLKVIAKACGIDKHITFHQSRHSFATLALTKGVPIESVSKMLGHTKITTTQIYAKITNEKIGQDMDMFSKKLTRLNRLELK